MQRLPPVGAINSLPGVGSSRTSISPSITALVHSAISGACMPRIPPTSIGGSMATRCAYLCSNLFDRVEGGGDTTGVPSIVICCSDLCRGLLHLVPKGISGWHWSQSFSAVNLACASWTSSVNVPREVAWETKYSKSWMASSSCPLA